MFQTKVQGAGGKQPSPQYVRNASASWLCAEAFVCLLNPTRRDQHFSYGGACHLFQPRSAFRPCPVKYILNYLGPKSLEKQSRTISSQSPSSVKSLNISMSAIWALAPSQRLAREPSSAINLMSPIVSSSEDVSFFAIFVSGGEIRVGLRRICDQ